MKVRCIDDDGRKIASVERGHIFDVVRTIDDKEFGLFYVVRSQITGRLVAIKASRFEVLKGTDNEDRQVD